MPRYLGRKILFAIPTLWLALTVVFFALRVIPGDPAVMIAGDFATPAVVAQIRHEVGLDKPLALQYGRFMSDALRGDFGRSLQFGVPVRQEVLRAAPISLELAVVSLVLATVVGVSAGALAAAKQHRFLDTALSLGMLSGLSIPAFWLGLLLILAFGLWLHLLPISGVLNPGVSLHRITGSVLIDSLIQGRFSVFKDAVLHMIMPAVTLALAPAAIISRMTRSAVLDVLKEDYVRTARAKGLGERAVLWGHVLKNASIPVVTLIGLQAGYLISGAVVVETIFARPGVGWLTTQAVMFHDYPLVEGLAFFGVALFIAINVAVDVLYWAIDPRSRLSLG